MGSPNCSGEIEEACRNLVKDRMERSGMPWSLGCARSTLHVRATYHSDYWNQLHDQRKDHDRYTRQPISGRTLQVIGTRVLTGETPVNTRSEV